LVYLTNGWVNPVERTIRGTALGRRNYLFAGSDNGDYRTALMYSLIEISKLNDVGQFAYLKHALTWLPALPHTLLDELLSWNWLTVAKPQALVNKVTEMDPKLGYADLRYKKHVILAIRSGINQALISIHL
jgi:hypothetical protein